MVHLVVDKNLVFIPKSQKNYMDFVNSFLVKYEEVTQVDHINSTRFKKKLKTVRERRELYTEDDSFIMFARGILDLIPETEYKASVSGKNKVIRPKLTFEEIKKSLNCFDLRDDQIVAVNKGISAQRGIIQLPTGTGKSAIISAIIKQILKVNPSIKLLVLAPTLSTVKNINDTFIENEIDSEVFGHPNKKLSKPVTVALVQSLVTQEDGFLDGINGVFYDECLPSNSKILLADGTEATIGEVYSNEKITEVLSYNIETNTYEPKKILRKFKTSFDDRFCKVYYKDTSDKLVGVSCTKNHKIYTKNRGYVPAEELTSDDYIKIDYPYARNVNALISFTYAKVERVTLNVGKIAEFKYNIEVEDNHNYFANHVLVSNCHHLKCDTWNRLNTMLPNVEYSLGFSALSINKDEIFCKDFRNLSYESALIVGSSGRVLMHMDPSYYIERGIIALPIVFNIEHFEALPPNFNESNWQALVKKVLTSDARTEKIANVASMFSKYGRKTLILVSERKYAFRVCEELVKNDITSFGVSFGSGDGFIFRGFKPPSKNGEMNIDYKKENSMNVVDMLDSGDIDILIATSHLDEGVDVKGLDACILASGGKKDRRIIQRIGRVLRKTKNGKYAYIIDFTDSGSKILNRQSKMRLDMFKDNVGIPQKNIFEKVPIENVENIFKKLEDL